MICIQQTDNTYDSVNFDDPISTLSYFSKLYRPFTTTSEEDLNRFFKGVMMRMSGKKTRDGSTKSAEVQVHDTLRSAAEKIHSAFREFNQDSIAITFQLVTLVMNETIESILYLIHDDVEFSTPDWKILSG